jgi:hypothetical protein
MTRDVFAPTPSGGGAHVFEVTDLAVPAGTDWSASGYVLGSVNVVAGQLVIAHFWLEVEQVPDPLNNFDKLALTYWADPDNIPTTSDYGPTITPDTDVRVADTRAGIVQDYGNGYIGLQPVNFQDGTHGGGLTPSVDATWQVGLYTPTALVGALQVVRARAEFRV